MYIFGYMNRLSAPTLGRFFFLRDNALTTTIDYSMAAVIALYKTYLDILKNIN